MRRAKSEVMRLQRESTAAASRCPFPSFLLSCSPLSASFVFAQALQKSHSSTLHTSAISHQKPCLPGLSGLISSSTCPALRLQAPLRQSAASLTTTHGRFAKDLKILAKYLSSYCAQYGPPWTWRKIQQTDPWRCVPLKFFKLSSKDPPSDNDL